MSPFAQFVQDIVVPALITVGTVAVPVLSKKAVDLLSAKSQSGRNDYIQGVFQRAIALAGQKVLMLQQTEIAFLKQQMAQGKVTKEQLPALLEGVKKHAVEAVKRDAQAHGLWAQLDKIFNGDGASLDKWLADTIESQVAQLPPTKLDAQKTSVINPPPASKAA